MSYLKMEAAVRGGALQEAPGLLAWVEEEVAFSRRESRAASEQSIDKLAYLERLLSREQGATSLPSGLSVKDARVRVAALRESLLGLPASSSGQLGCRDGGHAAPPSDDSAVSIAAFLRPAAPDADEARLMAAEGRLAGELSKYPVFAVPGTQSAVVFRSWTEQDDETEAERERWAMLEISEAMANTVEIVRMLGDRVEDAQTALDRIEESVREASLDVAEGSEALADSSKKRRKFLRRAAASGSLVVLGAAAAATGPAGCAACMAARAVLVVGAAATTSLGVRSVLWRQKKALELMQGHLPRALHSIPETDTALLMLAGDRAQARLLAKLYAGAWARFRHPAELWHGLTLSESSSDARPGKHAYRASLTVQLPAKRAFQMVRDLAVSGSLDPGCEVCWSRPVGDKGGTFMRYLLFNSWLRLFSSRDFFAVARCAAASSEPAGSQASTTEEARRADESKLSEDVCMGQTFSELPPMEEVPLGQTFSAAEDAAGADCARDERYVFAVASLSPDEYPEYAGLLERAGVQQSDKIQHGKIHVCGVALTARDASSCDVEVVADVDAGIWLADREMRVHVIDTAARLLSAFRAA